MKLQNKSKLGEYIKYIIILLWAVCLRYSNSRSAMGRCRRNLLHFWHFKSSLQMLRENFTTKLSLPRFLLLQVQP